MQPTSESKHRIMECLRTLDLLDSSAEDSLFLYDLIEDKAYFADRIDQKFNLLPLTDGAYSSAVLNTIIDVRSGTMTFSECMHAAARTAPGNPIVKDCELFSQTGARTRVKITCHVHDASDVTGPSSLIIVKIANASSSADIDTLTGLSNAKELSRNLTESIQSGQKGLLLVLGIDNFKNINNKYGRGYGNNILKIVAETLERLVSSPEQVYRLDNDKFAIHAVGGTKDSVGRFYLRSKEMLTMYCTLSVGVAEYGVGTAGDADMLLQKAESAMDYAKRQGKNMQIFFSDTIYERQMSMVVLQDELRRSVFNSFEGFSLVYQPQIDCHTFEIRSAEALLRYISPTRGKISPDEFIPILEQTGLIVDVGAWVMETALRQCAEWRGLLPDFHVSVNISYVQLMEQNFADFVLSLLDKLGVPGCALILEVTESIQLQDYPFFNKIFYKLEHVGIRISIDDFGTGYSSLSYLKGLAIDEVKIDRNFITGIQHSAYNYRLLNNIIELAHSVQITVCCEGVETEEELLSLRELNPDLLQGYLFAKPYDALQLEAHYILSNHEDYAKTREQISYYNALGISQSMEDRERLEQEKIGTIVNNMEEIIYVRNPKTRELLYLNASGREITGMYDYKRRKCYEVLHGRTSPCPFCKSTSQQDDDYYVWEVDNQHLNRHFLLKEKRIQWIGETARLTIAIDVTQKEITSQKLQEKLDYATNIISCTKMLAEEDNRSKAITALLRSVGEFYQASRAYLFKLQPGKDAWNNTFAWFRDGVAPQIHMLQDVPLSVTERWYDNFSKGEPVIIENVAELEKTFPDEWRTLHMQNINNLIVSPIRRGLETIGFIGVDNPKRHVIDSAEIQTIAFFLSDYLIKDETKTRLGELLSLHYEDVLKITELGLWGIRMRPDHTGCQMFADQTMKDIMGADAGLTPEACYDHWYSRISDGYIPYVNYGVESMMETGRMVELTYTWNHPNKGIVTVRCLGVRIADNDGMICLTGYHRNINTIDMPTFLPGEQSIIFEYNETTKSIYFHHNRGTLAGTEDLEKDFPACWLQSKMVHPHFAHAFSVVFDDIRQPSAWEGKEFLLKTQQGSYSWFKLKTQYMGDIGQDSHTMVVLLEPAEQERRLELDYMRQNDFYHAMLSETVAYVEIDMESKHILAMGGLWKLYADEQTWHERNYLDILTQYLHLYVSQEDIETICRFLHEDTMSELLQRGERSAKLQFRHLINEEMHWVEMTGHIFQEQFSETTSALLYVKDIDAQKKREQAQEIAATRDPLTKVYNRRAFEEEVIKYMVTTTPEGTGTLLLIDIDDFKAINDTYGHAGGDNALKILADVLLGTFRRKDIVGRLGGDEFLVFLKDLTNPSIIDRRVQNIHDALQSSLDGIPFTCSIGITIVHRDNFSYQDCLRRADLAMYQCKAQGKNTHHYFEESDDTKEIPYDRFQ